MMSVKNDNDLELMFPFKGLNETVSYSHQPSLTSAYLINVRPKGSEENRMRGGQRAGLSKVFITQAGSNRPVIKIVQCVNTYIEPA